MSNGDARVALNVLEMGAQATTPGADAYRRGMCNPHYREYLTEPEESGILPPVHLRTARTEEEDV